MTSDPISKSKLGNSTKILSQKRSTKSDKAGSLKPARKKKSSKSKVSAETCAETRNDGDELTEYEADIRNKASRIFQKFDKFEDGKVDLKHLVTMIQLLNQAVTSEQLDEMYQSVQAKYPEQELDFIRLTLADFYELVDEIYEPISQSRRRLTVALQLLDTKHTGMISKTELSAKLVEIGDVLTESEVKEFMQTLSKTKDSVPIETIVNVLCSNGRPTRKQTQKKKEKNCKPQNKDST